MAPPNISDTAATTTPLDANPSSQAETANGVPVPNQPLVAAEDISATVNVNTDQEDRDIWARSEGYTPLADYQGGSMMMMMMMMTMDDPSSIESDDGEDEAEQRQGAGGTSGAFFVDVAAFGSAAASMTFQDDDGDDEEDNENDNNQHGKSENVRGSDNNDSEHDFRTMADRALSSLDEEYSRTVQGACETVSKTDLTAPAANENYSLFPVTASMPLFLDDDEDIVVDTTDQQHIKLPKKEIPQIDTDAVRRAVQAISLRAPSLVVNKNKWQERLEQKPIPKASIAPPEHGIIPKAPLQAFRKRSQKAVQATANLTRSATLAEGLLRVLWKESNTTASFTTETESVACTAERLIIHIVGVDHVECASPEHTRSSFGPFVRWLGVSQWAPRHVELHLVGPNIPTHAISNTPATSTTSVNFMPATLPQRSNLESAVATYHRAKYHDWWPKHSKEVENDAPQLVICFNAGIWGYDEWRPTLEILCNFSQSIPFIATAYTMQEAEDDWDVIHNVLVAANSSNQNEGSSNVEQQRCLWNVEANPFASKVLRPTATAVSGRDYRENAAWQAWRFGLGRPGA